MVSWLFLLVALLGGAFTLASLCRLRTGFLLVPYFFSGWLAGELALLHIGWQAIATIAFVAAGALGAWPGWLALLITLLSWRGLLLAQARAREASGVFARALGATLGDSWARPGPPASWSRLVRPFHLQAPGVERISGIVYGDDEKFNRLDIFRNRSRPERAPVLLQIHGGAWVLGQKEYQALPLMNHLAAKGWLCVNADYRLSPRATFPDHLVDVKRALAWVRRHGADYGADPDFVVVTGGSAGGHLASLLALTANDSRYQPGFEEVDTSVAACVPFYGVYDFLDRNGSRARASMTPFLKSTVMKCDPVDHRARWEAASPLSQVREDAPPFFVIHGTHDSLVFVEEARVFVDQLRATSRNAVLYAELPGAQHAYEVFHSERTEQTLRAVTAFVESVRKDRQGNPSSGSSD